MPAVFYTQPFCVQTLYHTCRGILHSTILCANAVAYHVEVDVVLEGILKPNDPRVVRRRQDVALRLDVAHLPRVVKLSVECPRAKGTFIASVRYRCRPVESSIVHTSNTNGTQ